MHPGDLGITKALLTWPEMERRAPLGPIFLDTEIGTSQTQR